MPAIRYFHVDAFADAPFGGNQAAVMIYDTPPDDAFPPDPVMQKIGAENNFAETAFVAPDGSGHADWRLRWFTPEAEVRLCGHATLAAGHVLLRPDGADAVRFATRDAGVLTVRREGRLLELALPVIATEPAAWAEAVDALGAQPLDIARSADGYAVFLFAEAATIGALDPDFPALAALGNHQFICTAPGTDSDIVSRVFVPGAGVDEDSVTGSAHAALTPFWAARLGRDRFTAFQASRRGGMVHCRIDGDTVGLGGSCVTVVEGVFRY